MSLTETIDVADLTEALTKFAWRLNAERILDKTSLLELTLSFFEGVSSMMHADMSIIQTWSAINLAPPKYEVIWSLDSYQSAPPKLQIGIKAFDSVGLLLLRRSYVGGRDPSTSDPAGVEVRHA
ncbi:MAG: hypothetical protein WA840_15200 [Caulobacteraceae bacterium]